MRLFLAKRVDGLLITKVAGGLDPGIAARLRASGTPVVR